MVTEGVSSNSNSGKKSSSVVVTAFSKERNFDATAVNIAKEVLNNKAYQQKDYIGVVMVYGYDIGIWSQWFRQKYWQTPEEWRKM
jgi:hypothetical protein